MNIEVLDLKLKESGSLRGFAVVNVGGVIIHDVRVIDGKNGLFAGFPQRQLPPKDGQPGKYLPVVSIDDKGLRAEVNDAVVAEYRRMTRPADSEGQRDPQNMGPITDEMIPF